MSSTQKMLKAAQWPNGCDRTVPRALRYLANNDRPIGGESTFNSEHLYQLASEIESMTKRELFALTDAGEAERAERRSEALAAIATLKAKGYTYTGGVLWKPPLGDRPAFPQVPVPVNRETVCKGAWALGTACSNCARCENTDPAKGMLLTLVTASEIKGKRKFWFGREDQNDALRPIRIDADNAIEAWAYLRKQMANAQPPHSTAAGAQ